MSERDPLDGTNSLLGYIIGIIAGVMLAYTFYPASGVLP
jgi:uncharacterized membrane protein required for colicin V production